MRRRRLLGGAGALLAGLAGCLDERPDRLRWHTPVGSDSPRGIALAAGVVAVPKQFETFGVGRDGGVSWSRFDYGGPVHPLADGFLALGAPLYHPRNATNPAVLHRLGAEGPVRWEQPVGRLDAFVGMDTGGGRAYVLGGDPEMETDGPVLAALSLADGGELWRTRLAARALGPRLVDGTLVTAGDSVVGRDPATGAVRWRRDGVDGPWPPAVADGRLYCTRETPPAVVVRGSDGTERGRYALPGDRARGPVSVAGDVAVARTTAGAWAVDPTTGARRWAWPGDDPLARADPRATLATTDRGLVVVDERRRVSTVTRDGRRAWRVAVPGGAAVVTASSSVVYAAGDRGLFALDA